MFRSSLVGVAALIAISLPALSLSAFAQDEMPAPAAPAPAAVQADMDAPRPVPDESLRIALDIATVMRIPEGTDTLAIGNPSIADVTKPQSGGFTVVTGKSYGATNLLALNSKGETLKEMMIFVGAPAQRTVVIQRGMTRETWSCAPRCEPTVTLGDGPDYFGSSSGQIGSRNGLATQR
jgi:Flp pilus assembly secretin CpaC